MDGHATTSRHVWMGMLQQVDMYGGHASTSRHVWMGMLQQVGMYGLACYNK